MESSLSSAWLREVPFSLSIVFLLSQMATAYFCPSCTFKLQSLCNTSFFHPLSNFWCPLGIRHHWSLRTQEWMYKMSTLIILYNVIDLCRRGYESANWGLVYAAKLLDGDDAWKNPFCKYLLSLLCFCSSLISRMPWVSRMLDLSLTSHPWNPFLPQAPLPNPIALGVICQQFWVAFLDSLTTQGLPLHHLRTTWGYFSFWIIWV